MNTEQKVAFELPDWVREALEIGEPTDNLANKRAQPRRTWSDSCIARPTDGDAESLHVRLFNVSPGGLGLISRKPIEISQRLRINSEYGPDQSAVLVRVTHCTQTVQGYKIGCQFEPV